MRCPALSTILSMLILGMTSNISFGGAMILPDGHLTDLGLFGPGTYTLTSNGLVTLGAPQFIMQPDGIPSIPVPYPDYYYFNPNGSYTADGDYGPAGLNAKIGALIGTFSPNPSSPSDWFQIGYSKEITLSVAHNIYAAVNDTYYPNDSGYFEVTVSSTAVPEPSSVFLAGLGGLGIAFGAYRQRRIR